jgi:hypothetical protein
VPHYLAVLKTLETIATQKNDTGGKSCGLLEEFSKESTILGLESINKVFLILEQLNNSQQAE